MSPSFVVVCEAEQDRRTGCGLADRVFCAEVDWVEEELDPHRSWRGLLESEQHILWRDVPDLSRKLPVSPAHLHGHFGGEPGEPDAIAARRALLVIKHKSDRKPDAVVLLRDDDGVSDRRRGLEQAREHVKIGVPVVIGLARTKRECWVLAGFVLKTAAEKEALEAIRAEIGFDPCREPLRLNSPQKGDPRSIKDVLAKLTGDDWERESECWTLCDLDLLRERGEDTGLAAYLKEVESELVPLITGRTPPPQG
ncbi:MAG TPA: hypothetical protein VG406_02665 [Isosphaeraceae bacterium]|jgi:hypothetical protein|nr:hypothetical protein [Isosphaeraceae bacterium]